MLRWSVFALLAAQAILAGGCGLLAVPAMAQGQAQGQIQTQVQNSPAASASETARWRLELAAWRAQREQQLAAPDGPLTLVGMEWLKPGVNSVGTAADNQIRVHAQAPEHIGLITVIGATPQGQGKASKGQSKPRNSQGKRGEGQGNSGSGQIVQLLSPAGGFPADLKIDGQPAREGPLAVEGAKPSTISWHGLTMVVLNRGGRYALRMKDADAPTRAGFHGLNWYAPDPHYRVDALWTPFTPAHIEQIPTVLGPALGLAAPGVAEFMLGDRTMRLEPVIEDPEGKTLFFILRDETSTSTTNEVARYLHTGLPSHGLDQRGILTLDFNRLENPPCAYAPYATCPLPPVQNRLGVALEAGEKRYGK
jgi:uncharacterized protein (DUF1684 family)